MPFLNCPWIVIFLIVVIGKGSDLAGLNLEAGNDHASVKFDERAIIANE